VNRPEKGAEDGSKSEDGAAPSLVCYAFPAGAPSFRPAPHTRKWMDETPDAFAYRCLPLVIANAHAWEILNPVPFEATWSGAIQGGVRVRSLDDRRPYASDHFGSGILTFHLNALFRTEPGTNLFVTGPLNLPKHGIAPLTAVVETDWSPASFTMNWKFTAPEVPVRFEQDEPICAFFPVARGALDRIEPSIEPIEHHREARDQYAAWAAARARFLQELPVMGTAANRRGWEKTYFQGRRPDGGMGPVDHQTKLRLKPFARRDDQLTSLIHVIQHPDQYQGKKVRVVGFCNLELEGKALYVSEADYPAGTKNAVWLDVPLSPENQVVNEKVALVEGTFDGTALGHLGMYSGTIKDVERLQVWSDPDSGPR
jgi:hypothetical protein